MRNNKEKEEKPLIKSFRYSIVNSLFYGDDSFSPGGSWKWGKRKLFGSFTENDIRNFPTGLNGCGDDINHGNRVL